MVIIRNIIYVLPFILLLASEPLLVDFINKDPSVSIYDKVYAFLQMASLAGAFIFFNRLTRFLQIWLVVITVVFAYMIFESLYLYNSFIGYAHVLTKITNLYLIFGFYLFYKQFETKKFKYIIHLVFWLFILAYVI